MKSPIVQSKASSHYFRLRVCILAATGEDVTGLMRLFLCNLGIVILIFAFFFDFNFGETLIVISCPNIFKKRNNRSRENPANLPVLKAEILG